jgi:hypothetical protein
MSMFLVPRRAARPQGAWGFHPHQKRFLFAGGLPLRLFRGVRTFTLSPQGDGVTTFTMREEYTGPLLPLIWRTMPDLGPSFEQFATGLKRLAERPA